MTVITSHLESNRVFDEFSPKKFILLGRSATGYLLSKWIIIILIALVFGLLAAIVTFLKKPKYIAEVTFALDEQVTESSKNNFPVLNEELGFGTYPDAGTIFSSMTNIVELMQSRLLIEKTLRSSINIDGKPVVFADFFLDSLDYRDKWMKNSTWYHLDFTSAKKDKNETRFENSIIRNIYEALITKYIKVDKKGKSTTIISVTCNSEHELFSKTFLEAWLNEVTQYYIDTRTQRAKLNLSLIQSRTDSIRYAYNKALYGRAAFVDAHVNPGRQTASVSGEKQQTDVQILKASYIELVKSLEAAKTALMRDTPLIQFLDTPVLPLKMNKPGWAKQFIIFFIIGGVIAAGFLLVRKTYFVILDRD